MDSGFSLREPRNDRLMEHSAKLHLHCSPWFCRAALRWKIFLPALLGFSCICI